jgi:hypothetical protein
MWIKCQRFNRNGVSTSAFSRQYLWCYYVWKGTNKNTNPTCTDIGWIWATTRVYEDKNTGWQLHKIFWLVVSLTFFFLISVEREISHIAVLHPEILIRLFGKGWELCLEEWCIELCPDCPNCTWSIHYSCKRSSSLFPPMPFLASSC